MEPTFVDAKRLLWGDSGFSSRFLPAWKKTEVLKKLKNFEKLKDGT